jgi:hypothetical protein
VLPFLPTPSSLLQQSLCITQKRFLNKECFQLLL